MTCAVGWYGPLIDLSRASSHVGDFVQLLVFLHPSTLFEIVCPHYWQYLSQKDMQFLRNWKLPEERKSKDCFLLSEVLLLTDLCKAVFYASVGEFFLPLIGTTLGEPDKEKMFLSRRLYKTGDSSLATDLISTGCQLCSSPLNVEQGRSMFEKDATPLYYSLYVWDGSEHIPLIVRNKAAELLFGNIKGQ